MRERRWALLAVAQYQRRTPGRGAAHHPPGQVVAPRDSSGLTWGRSSQPSRRLILRQDESLLLARPDPGRAELPLPRPRGRTTSTTPSRSSAASATCSPAWRSCASTAPWLWSARRAAASRRWCVPASPPRCAGRAATSSSERRGSTRCSRWPRRLTPRPGSVLLVDQCEEVFALCHDERENGRSSSPPSIERAERGPLVLAMRADRLAEVAAHPRFARLLERSLHLLGAMTEHGLTEAVESPARQAGLLIEPGLVDLIVGEVAGAPGALPMLSHALLETWKRREGNTLTVAGVRRDRRHPRRGGAVRRAGLREHRARAATPAARPGAAAGDGRRRRVSRCEVGCPGGCCPPTPRARDSSTCWSRRGW